ncbi:small integral membrane protein 44 [Nothobranchius furzeri]|uniref:Uncharacterized protein n=1 Tax=Nothobranchius furzeri TaxID=105023 RepID=A0A1A8UJZ9_NOTFU|nr:small integral membrane protein 44-like [Nothobranchius furzeri]XP_054595360.1 small integral membrane protein 44-like [Nothobranchius furzeri]XP_054595361.1 small integral membrane protein 44-like [Nothobranchius furzeri]XP_054595363.1 small integral membrane protein 44-like [Nothobranchius furzeri]
MNQEVIAPLTSGGTPLLNLTQLVFEHRQLLQLSSPKDEEDAYFVDYVPPARDAITLPRSVVYVLVGVVLIIVVTYAIVGHLIKDLMHDLADWIFGPKPVEKDPEDEAAEEEQRLSISSDQMEIGDKLRMGNEKEMLLPGSHLGDGGCRRPAPPPPLRSAIASSYPGEKRMSTHSVTFAGPFVTSL